MSDVEPLLSGCCAGERMVRARFAFAACIAFARDETLTVGEEAEIEEGSGGHLCVGEAETRFGGENVLPSRLSSSSHVWELSNSSGVIWVGSSETGKSGAERSIVGEGELVL